MLESGTDPESYITEYTLVYEDKTVGEIDFYPVYIQGLKSLEGQIERHACEVQ